MTSPGSHPAPHPKRRLLIQRSRAFLERAIDIWKTHHKDTTRRVLFWTAVVWVAAILLQV
jgi:hypothetical protein